MDENTRIVVNTRGDSKTIKELSVGEVINDNNEIIGIVELLTEAYNVYYWNGVIGTSYIKLKINDRWTNLHMIENIEKKEGYNGKLYHILTKKGNIEVLDKNNKCINIRDYSEYESSDLFTLISDLSVGYE